MWKCDSTVLFILLNSFYSKKVKDWRTAYALRGKQGGLIIGITDWRMKNAWHGPTTSNTRKRI